MRARERTYTVTRCMIISSRVHATPDELLARASKISKWGGGASQVTLQFDLEVQASKTRDGSSIAGLFPPSVKQRALPGFMQIVSSCINPRCAWPVRDRPSGLFGSRPVNLREDSERVVVVLGDLWRWVLRAGPRHQMRKVAAPPKVQEKWRVPSSGTVFGQCNWSRGPGLGQPLQRRYFFEPCCRATSTKGHPGSGVGPMRFCFMVQTVWWQSQADAKLQRGLLLPCLPGYTFGPRT